jgi:hypothetical protein
MISATMAPTVIVPNAYNAYIHQGTLHLLSSVIDLGHASSNSNLLIREITNLMSRDQVSIESVCVQETHEILAVFPVVTEHDALANQHLSFIVIEVLGGLISEQ